MIIKKNRIIKNIEIDKDYKNFLYFDSIRYNTFFDRFNNYLNNNTDIHYINSEVIVITNEQNEYIVRQWLFWYSTILKFDKIIFVDNTNNNTYNAIVKDYDNVEYFHYPGNISQSEIYNIFGKKSTASWILFVDIDEFLYISKKYKDINDFIIQVYKKYKYLKFSISWLHLFSNELHDSIEYDNRLTFLNYFNYYYMNNNYYNFNSVKTLQFNGLTYNFFDDKNSEKFFCNLNEFNCNKEIPEYLYRSNYDHIGTVHNPLSILDNTILLSYNLSDNNFNIGYKGYFINNITNYFSECCLFHLKYRTINEWVNKVTNLNNFNDSIYTAYNKDEIIDIFNKIDVNLKKLDDNNIC